MPEILQMIFKMPDIRQMKLSGSRNRISIPNIFYIRILLFFFQIKMSSSAVKKKPFKVSSEKIMDEDPVFGSGYGSGVLGPDL